MSAEEQRRKYIDELWEIQLSDGGITIDDPSTCLGLTDEEIEYITGERIHNVKR